MFSCHKILGRVSLNIFFSLRPEPPKEVYFGFQNVPFMGGKIKNSDFTGSSYYV